MNTAQSVNNTVKTTADIINTVKPVENKENKQPNNNYSNETLYKLVPIE